MALARHQRSERELAARHARITLEARATLPAVFHVEVRQFPNVARSFNLSRDELEARILVPWRSGRPVQMNDRRYAPERAKLTIYEGRELRPEEIGLGRGWANVTRLGAEVTEQVLSAESPVEEFKQAVIELLGARSVGVDGVLRLATERFPGWRLSERLALAERSVWELLHQRRLRMFRGEAEVPDAEWQDVLLSWESWRGERVAVLEARSEEG
jgi:hypothetical protein